MVLARLAVAIAKPMRGMVVLVETLAVGMVTIGIGSKIVEFTFRILTKFQQKQLITITTLMQWK